MVVPDPPLSRKSKDKDAVLHITSPQIASPATSQEFSRFNGYSFSVTSYSPSPSEELNDIVTNPEPSHLSNLALFAKNKTPSGSGYSKIRTGSQSSSNSWPRKYVKNKNLKFHVKYGIACAIPELYVENTYSGQNSSNPDYSYSASCYDTPVACSYHNISTDVNGYLSSSRYKTSNFSLISDEKGLHHQVGEGQRALFSQSVYNTQGLQESSSVTSDSSKKRLKNKNSKLRKEAYCASKTDSVKPYFCLYGKIVHTDDCKCRKVNLWNRSLLSVWHPDKVSNSDTTSCSNFFQNNFDDNIHDLDKQVSSISEKITTDSDVSVPVSVTKRIHSGQTKLESICESAQETNNQLIEYDLESKLRVFSPETSDCYLPLKGQLEKFHGTSNFRSREESESESFEIEHFQQTYDSVKNLPFESLSSRAANLSTELKEKVQVNEPYQHNALTAAAEDLAQSLYTVTDSAHYSQTKNNTKASDRPATKNDLASCLALFDNLIFKIEDQLREQVPCRGESFIDEQFGLDTLAVPCSQSTTTMASQGKKNKNQFLRKAAPASPVNTSCEEGSRFSCPDVISIQSGIAEVSIDNVSVSTGLKDMNVTSKNESAQGSLPEFGSEQHGIPSDAGASDGPCIPRQKYDPGGIDTVSSINIQYLDHSSSVPTIQSHPYSSPTTGSSSQSAYQNSTGNNGTPPVSKTRPCVPLAKPPRTSKSETLGQYSVSSIHKEADPGSAPILSGIFSNTQQQHASRLQLDAMQPNNIRYSDHLSSGGSMQPVQGRLDGGILGQMHPHAQLDAMQPNKQSYMRDFQDVHNQHGSMTQGWDIPADCRHGDDWSSTTYSPGVGVSDNAGMPSYMTDRELAQEQLDQKMNNPWFQQMVQNMKELVEKEGLIVKDVFPDGNCLFTAVVDQLRVRGNFKYTPSTLRAAAVRYISENPKQRDGTHLEQFLMSETWEHYLGRMSRDGEWGEHIILGLLLTNFIDPDLLVRYAMANLGLCSLHMALTSISEVLRCRINVLGGMSGKSHTIVQPQDMSDKEEEEREKKREEAKDGGTISDSQSAETASSDKSPSQEETSSEISQSKTGSQSPSPQTGAQSKSLQTGAVSSHIQTDAKAKSTGTSQIKDKTASRSKQNWDKENEELTIGEELFIGLLGEMHYVSLRRKDWEERLHEKLWARIKKREARRKGGSDGKDDFSSDDDIHLPEDSKSLLDPDVNFDPRSGASLPHLNYLVQQLASSPYLVDYLESFLGPVMERFKEMKGTDYNCYAVGLWIGYLECLPKVLSVPSFGLFSTDTGTTKKLGESITPDRILKLYYTPNDTKVDFDGHARTDDTDLIGDRTNCSSGFVKLYPINPDLWYSALVQDGEKLILKHMPCKPYSETEGNLNSKIAFSCSWKDDANEWLTRDMPSGWLEPSSRSIVSHQLCLIIPVSSPKSRDLEVEWKVSFELAEEKLIELAIYKHKYLVLGYRLLGFILQTQLKERYEECKEILRHVFFQACEQIPEKEWKEKPAPYALFTLANLERQLKEKHVPHYFVPCINLIDHIQADFMNLLLEKVEIVLDYPLFSIWYLLEEIGLQSSFITTFDAAVEDERSFAEHRDLNKSKHEFFIPQLVRKMCSQVKMDFYEKAFDLCVSAFEDITCYVDGVTFQDFIMSALNELSVSERWCFAFFCDSCQGTSFLPVVCKGIVTTSLTTVFGSEIVHHIRTVDVPSQSITPTRVLDFVNKITSILYSQLNFIAVVVGLKTFLLDHLDKHSGTYLFDSCSEGLHLSNRDKRATSKGLRFKTLAKLHERLFKACTKTKRQEDYRPFVEPYENICEALGHAVCYYNLAEMWESFGDFERMQIAILKYRSVRS